MVRAINRLPRNRAYTYIEPSTSTKIHIVDIVEPEGPIKIKRFDPVKGGSLRTAKTESMSAGMIRRVANAISDGVPLNLDRVLGASYNTRSAFETLLAHTPEFCFCYPGRIDISESSSEIKEGHKHLVWVPDAPHANGVLKSKEVNNMTISEIPTMQAVYEALILPPIQANDPTAAPKIEIQRRHAQIQVALVEIGRELGFRTWVAQNDRGIVYKGQRLGELNGVIVRLDEEKLISSYGEAIRAALLIDVIWFKNATLMPAVIEIEHTTGVTSGLARMKNFQDRIPEFARTRWVIAAADEDKAKVTQEANKPQFRSLRAQFLPYSAVDELYSISQRRRLRGVTDEFIDSFTETVVQ
ncbi:MAG: restriction endonuclease [Candidatus Angelobacter sp.]